MLTLKVISLYSSDETCRQVESSAGSIGGVTIDSRQIHGDIVGRIHNIGIEENCDVLFVECSKDLDPDTLSLIEEEISRISESVAIYPIFADANVQLLRSMLKAGVRDVLPLPLDRADIVNQITGVLSEKRERIMNSKGGLSSVYAFINAKGGSGASTLAVNFAVELARNTDYKVALIDLDLQLGSCADMLDISANSNVFDAITQSDRVDSVFVKALMTRHESGLDVLPSPGQLTSMSDVSVEDIRRVLDGLAEAYDVVVLDVPNIYLPWTIEALRMSERVMLVLQNEFSAIKDGRIVIDNMPAMGIPVDRVEVINNRACAKSPAASLDDLKQTLGITRIHRIRTDFQVCIDAHSQGKPVSKISSSSKMVKDIQRLAQYANEGLLHPGEDPVVYRDAGFWKRMSIR